MSGAHISQLTDRRFPAEPYLLASFCLQRFSLLFGGALFELALVLSARVRLHQQTPLLVYFLIEFVIGLPFFLLTSRMVPAFTRSCRSFGIFQSRGSFPL